MVIILCILLEVSENFKNAKILILIWLPANLSNPANLRFIYLIHIIFIFE